MQTFLPYPDFKRSAKSLDNKRLGKQRVEGLQILNTLMGLSLGWKSHPTIKMWRGYERSLASYILACCEEWRSRGFSDSIKDFLEEEFSDLLKRDLINPFWFGDERLHSSHRSNLIRKDSMYRVLDKWTEPDNLPYFWPLT